MPKFAHPFGISGSDGGGSGNTTGAASSTDNAIARFDGTTGTTIQNSGVIIDDSNNVSAANSVSVGTTPATTGSFRVANNTNALVGRNAANNADLVLVSLSSGNVVGLGNTTSDVTVTANSTVNLVAGGVFALQVLAAQVAFNIGPINFSAASVPVINNTTRSTDVATNLFTIKAQSAFASATGTNRNGGNLLLQGGVRTDTNGRRGGVRLALNGSATEIMLEVTDVQAEVTAPSRVVALLGGAAITTTEMPTNTGDKVIYITNAATAPTASSVGGGILWCEAGALKFRGTSGTITTLGAA